MHSEEPKNKGMVTEKLKGESQGHHQNVGHKADPGSGQKFRQRLLADPNWKVQSLDFFFFLILTNVLDPSTNGQERLYLTMETNKL